MLHHHQGIALHRLPGQDLRDSEHRRLGREERRRCVVEEGKAIAQPELLDEELAGFLDDP
jgi:hypothetical protein